MDISNKLRSNQKTWLITGVAGFIGSHLAEYLLLNKQNVIGLDSFSSGSKMRVNRLKKKVLEAKDAKFTFVEEDIRNIKQCNDLVNKSDFILHHAAEISVVKSMGSPLLTHDVNVNGFLNILEACRVFQKKMIFASSSAVYSRAPTEHFSGLSGLSSPYGLSKFINEEYAMLYARLYKTQVIGLRYFNVFGENQSSDGVYASVIPKWIKLVLGGKPVEIFGDGNATRDFCHVSNVVRANVEAAFSIDSLNDVCGQTFDIGSGDSISIFRLLEVIQNEASNLSPELAVLPPIYSSSRAGEVKHSKSDISLATRFLNYQVQTDFRCGLKKTIKYFKDKLLSSSS